MGWHLDIHKPMGLHGIHPRILRELVGEVTKPLHHLSAALAHQGGPRQLGQCDPHAQERRIQGTTALSA